MILVCPDDNDLVNSAASIVVSVTGLRDTSNLRFCDLGHALKVVDEMCVAEIMLHIYAGGIIFYPVNS